MMPINNVIHDRILQPTSTSQPPVLRNGQIVQGEILKIHPNNRAEIQIGSHKMIAEITTPLSVGKKYFLQVQATDQLIQLRVLSNHLKQDNSVNILNLMQLLDVKVTRANTEFVQMLVNEKIPFNQEQIQQALSILDKSGDKTISMSVLKEMLLNRLPITDNVFQALLANRNSTISPVLQQLKAELTQLPQLNDVQQRLLTLLNNMVERPLPLNLHMAEHLMNQPQNREALFHLFKIANLIDPNVDMQSFNKRLEALLQGNSRQTLPLENIWNQIMSRGTASERPLTENQVTLQNNALQQTLTQLTNEARAIQSTAVKILGIFHPLQTNNLTTEQFSAFRSMITEQLLPLLPETTKRVLQPLLQQNTPQNQSQLLQVLQSLANQGTFQLSQQFLAMAATDQSMVDQPVQKQFLSHISQYFQSIGISDENILKSQIANTMEMGNISDLENKLPHTVKSLLLQMIQQDSTGTSERIQQILHFINGMQLQSVQESNNLLHASLQIPGEKLALNEDMYLQFEGRKTDDGKIDPDFCRILFVLDLQNLKTTVVDMHVQKRIVSVTIFNDGKDLSEQMIKLKSMLDTNLKSLNYHLSSIKWKPLHEQKREEKRDNVEEKINEQKERFDFLI